MAGYLEFPYNLRSNYPNQKLDEEGKEIKFLNYVPIDKTLRNFDSESNANRLHEIESRYNQVQKDITTSFLKDDMSQSINILPKKPNVDLKRNLAKRLERLNKRTELAIYDLLREKVTNLEVGNQSSSHQTQVSKPFGAEKDLKKNLQTKTISTNKYMNDDSEQIEDFEEEGDETGGQNLLEKIKLQEEMAKKQDKDLADDEDSSDSDSS
mmetsp:Transcript_12298/g.14127  ORF Transcript_12298/g.14127 Transcript_12298/m.14127 type:complete len:210 (-) Transcript_12298:142-771(-)